MEYVFCLRLKKTEKIKNRIDIMSYPQKTSEKKVSQENVMDQKSGVTIIGERKTQLRTYLRENMTQSCTDGLLTRDTKSPNRHMDGLLSIANTWSTSKPSVWTKLLLGMKETDTRTCSC